MLVPFFIPFSKNPHSDADQCQQKVGHKLYVHLLLIDPSNLVKALSEPLVHIEGLGVLTSDIAFTKLCPVLQGQLAHPMILLSEARMI